MADTQRIEITVASPRKAWSLRGYLCNPAKKEVEEFQREIKAFRIKSVTAYSVIPFVELLLHAYFGDHLAQIWFFSFALCLFFLAGLLVLIYDMRQHDKFDEKKYKSPTSLLYN